MCAPWCALTAPTCTGATGHAQAHGAAANMTEKKRPHTTQLSKMSK